MVGRYCCVVGCHNSQGKTKNSEITTSYFSFPKGTDLVSQQWRSKLISAVNRVDETFNADTMYICSAHFDKSCLLFHGKGFKLIPGSIPTVNMPQKSVETPKLPPRKAPSERPSPTLPEKVAYYNLGEVQRDGVKCLDWITLKSDKSVLVLGQYDHTAGCITKRVVINADLSVNVFFQEVCVKGLDRSIEKVTLTTFLKNVAAMSKCPGVKDFADVPIHSYDGYRFISTSIINGKPVTSTIIRAHTCSGGVKQTSRCEGCEKLLVIINKGITTKINKVHPKTPLTSLPQSTLIQEVKAARQENKRVQSVRAALQSEDQAMVEETVSEGLFQAIEGRKSDNSLMDLFWQEQKKAFSTSPKGMRWHPMMIRFAIYLQFQSSRAYEALRESGILRLPNKSTLRDYTNYIQPQSGFQPQAFEELKKIAYDLPPEKRYVALLHDEMKIKADLVYDRRSDQVIGFTSPDTWKFDEDETNRIASHILVFMVVGINSHVKMSIGHFPTKTSTADELYPLLWKAIAYLETSGLKVISSTSDKASPNQRLYRIHRTANEPIVFKTDNLFATEKRNVFFFSDAPHLVKTVRNNVYKSRPGGTKYLWNNDKNILWSHVEKVYTDDTQGQLYRTKLKYDHIYLTPSSTMSVRLAAQVLSDSVSRVLASYYGPDMSETAKFFSLVDRFFDCLNVRSLREAVQVRKPDLAPYKTINDPRFQFLQTEFLQYLDQWKTAVQNRQGFTKSEKNRMFLSHQTYEGILMTVHALIEAVKYLLGQGLPYVLSQDFCQDPLEEHFGRHRGLGARQDNPTIHQFSYQENQLRLQRGLAFAVTPKGNTAGRDGGKRPTSVSDSPLKRIKRH